MVGFDVLQQQINPIRRFNSNAQTPDSGITQNLTATLCLTFAVLLGSVGMVRCEEYFKSEEHYLFLEWQYPPAREGIKSFKERNYELALEKLRPLAQKGDPIVQYWMGRSHLFLGNYKDAMKWFKASYEKGHANSAEEIAEIYLRMKKPERYKQLSFSWSQAGARLGSLRSIKSMALWYATGMGVIRDHVYAHMWYNIAASAGDSFSPVMIADIEKRMTRSQIAEAEKLARECVRKKYKEC